MSGVPVDEVTAKDFIMVRAALVRRLGGANEALVWSRVHYRCDEDSRVAHDTDAGRWWAATYGVISEETGLTAKQARTAIDRLVADGFLLAEQHRLRSNYDQTYSYQAVVLGGQFHVPSGADEGALEGDSHVPSGADVPSSKRTREGKKNVELFKAASEGMRFAQPLCDVLVQELVRNEAKVPGSLPKKWLDDARLLVDADGRDPHEAKTLIEWACRDGFWRANILSMPTFRKQYDKLRLSRERASGRSTVDVGRAADELLRAREAADDRMAVSR